MQTQQQSQQSQQPQQAKRGRPVGSTKQVNQNESKVPAKVPRYIAMHQPERIFIIDTQTNDVVSEGFKDDGVAMAFAKIMNDQDTVIVGGGFQQ
jgi:hypothetical protein